MLASCLPRTCHHLCKTAVSRASAVPTGVLRAVRTDQDTSQQPAPQSEAQERSSAPASTSRQNPNAQRLKLEKVERLGSESWAGVAAVDRGNSNPRDWRWLAWLVAGDTATLLIFASVGQYSHHHELEPLAVLGTALPFIIGWTGAAALLKGYQQPASVTQGLWQTTRCWAPGITAGIAIRSLEKGYLPAVPFALVTYASTWVFLNLWRSAVTKAYPRKVSEQARRAATRQGNPFEFLQLLSSLVKRW